MEIKDSGTRREFETGAVRDIQEGKGRCDLLPLDIASDIMDNDVVLFGINQFMLCMNNNEKEDAKQYIIHALHYFAEKYFSTVPNMLLEVSIHFEQGAKKYAENNWKKGIPVKCYIDSGVRHYLKFLRGDKDEPHDRAFCWNMMCMLWTLDNID